MGHCEECRYLEFYEGNEFEGEGPSGFLCNKRVYKTSQDEAQHLRLLDSKEYRVLSKKCCEKRQELKNEITN